MPSAQPHSIRSREVFPHHQHRKPAAAAAGGEETTARQQPIASVLTPLYVVVRRRRHHHHLCMSMSLTVLYGQWKLSAHQQQHAEQQQRVTIHLYKHHQPDEPRGYVTAWPAVAVR